MNFIQSQNRQQMLMSSWDSSVESDNPFRLIDVFVDQLDLVKLKLQVRELKKEVRPAFESVVFLKLYFYGYLNGLRSSRRLERECCRSIELQWLLGALRPNYHVSLIFGNTIRWRIQSVYGEPSFIMTIYNFK